MTLTLTPQQVAALAQIELCMAILKTVSRAVPGALSAACIVCEKTLEKAHEEFTTATQQTVSIAAPADLTKLTGGA